jgi:hypothetical protein
MTYGLVLLIGIGIGLTMHRFNEWVKRRWEKQEILYSYSDVKKAWRNDNGE